MVCGNITGNISDPLNITFYTTESTVKTPNDSLHSTENQETHNSSTREMNNSAISRVYIISFSCLATALFVGAVTSFIVIAVFLKKSKAKIRTVFEQSNRAESTTLRESDYENITLSPSPSVSAINTQDNVAYGHTRISIRGARATQNVPMYQNDTNPVGIISTQDNVAYGQTKTRGAGAIQDVPMYQEVTDPIPLVSTIGTQDNVAYGCTQQL